MSGADDVNGWEALIVEQLFAKIFWKNIVCESHLFNSSKYCCRGCHLLVMIWVTLMLRSLQGSYSIILSFNVCAIQNTLANFNNVHVVGFASVSSSVHDSTSVSNSSFVNTSSWPSTSSSTSSSTSFHDLCHGASSTLS